MKIKYVVFFMIAFMAISVNACSQPIETINPYTSESTHLPYTQEGDWTWIDLSAYSEAGGDVITKNSELISDAIQYWQDDNPNREIVDLQIIASWSTYLRQSQLFGISIYSKVK